MPKTLNTMTFPLHGARLIEASAGTGKTFTISGLYLRLLLGHGAQNSRHSEPLTVDQILVVTFTEAATAELRDRIRSKIHEARMAFMRNESSDFFLSSLLAEVADKRGAIEILLNAERQMDEAAIYTIHGFCQRMLTQNAFESGSRFNNEFITDESTLKSQVVADYWRRNFYSLSLMLANEVRNIWPSPDKLLDDISRQLSGAPITLTVQPMQKTLPELHEENLAKIHALKVLWKEHQDDIANIINASDVNKRTFSKKTLPAWINDVSSWAEKPTQDYQCADKLEKFSQAFLQEKTKEGGQCPEHVVFERIEQFIANRPSLKEPLMAHAIHICRQQLQQIKQQKHWLSFDDLLTNLSVALDNDTEGLLAERVRTLYPVAMIDEFQDTDPLQYSIFSRIYLPYPNTGLFMIGDPKQAIYGFRGADIFTYIRARNEVTDHYTLSTNWRSSADMVAATNALFSQADSPFMYDNDIPFYPVDSRPNADERGWWLDGEKQNALTLWLQEADSPLSKKDYFQQMAHSTAAKIHQILKSSDKGSGYFLDGNGLDSKAKKKQIKAGDIAVLVRTGSEGHQVRQALAKMGIASVYLSNRDSVFTSPIAMSVLRLLQAVLHPEDERLLRAALASDILMKSSKALDDLNEDESKLEAMINAFREFRLVWQQRGVLPMLRAVMNAEKIAENLLAQEFGERLMTDFLHLSELLQQESQEQESEHALVRWFSQAIQDAHNDTSGTIDEQIQRLESERNLVQIVTIHKSKGLEYDLVFIPFISSYRESTSGQFYDAQQNKTILDITRSADSLALSDKERLAEDLRLLYVAITRAVYGCFMGIAPLRKGRSSKDPTGAHLSAIGYLIQNGVEGSTADLGCYLHKLISPNNAVMTLCYVPEAEALVQQELQLDHGNLKACHDLTAKQIHSIIDRSWRITSYSGLVKQGHVSHHKQSVVDVDISSGLDIDSADDSDLSDQHLLNDDNLADEILATPEASIFTFPRGARPGTFLHTLFEQIDFTLPATSPETTEIIRHLLQMEQYEESWLPILQKMIDTILTTPLDGKQLRLCEKDEHQKLVEMEFLLPIKQLSSFLLNKLVQQYDPLSATANELGFYDVKGMLKGFIDLVFVHEGKYYVLDWKSNHLGDEVSDYGQDALKQAMIDHRYDLQYQIYALALHRFLRNRIPDYDYQTHFGGVYYLFLRGVDEQGNGVFYNKPEQAFLMEFDRLIDGEQSEVANA